MLTVENNFFHIGGDKEFEEYCKMIEKEHEDISDEKLLENPTGIFSGMKRNARWMDEIKRRNLE